MPGDVADRRAPAREATVGGPLLACPICGYEGSDFAAWAQDSPLLAEARVIGAGPREHAICPQCGALDRQRLIAAWLRDARPWGENARVLHLGPEPALRPFLAEAVAGRIFEGGPGSVDGGRAREMDLRELYFRDAYFDGVICNDLLCRIDDSDLALAEIHRVLRPGGVAILQVPYRTDTEQTDEAGDAASGADRLMRLGRADHVRLFAFTDYRRRLEAAGFQLDLQSPDRLAPYRPHGVIADETLFVVRKPAAEARADRQDSPDRTRPELSCYLPDGVTLEIRPAPQEREWMDRTGERFAYRCLPLNIANAHGWELLCPGGFHAVWSGRPGIDAVSIFYDDAEGPRPAVSHFGSGVLTFRIQGLFRTEPGFDLWVGGPVNRPKPHIQALTGVIETDWSTHSFTMNWMFTSSSRTIRFERGEPFCMFFPVERGLVERFAPRFRSPQEDPELWAAHERSKESRGAFLRDLKVPGSEAQTERWQRHYFRGPADPVTPPHRTRLRLPPFKS